MSNKLLITGATGFVGGFVVEEAVAKGFEIYVAVRPSSSLQYIDSLPFTPIQFDLSDTSQMTEILAKYQFEYIIHNAGLTRHRFLDELEKVNASYLQNFLEAIHTSEIPLKKFVLTSSLAAIGPAEYTLEGILTEESSPHPVTNYGKSKLKGEQILKSFGESLPYLILRPTAVYGPRERDLYTIFKMINQGMLLNVGTGEQLLSLIYVKDLARLMIQSLTISQVGETYLVADGETYTTRNFQNEIKKLLSRKTLNLSLPFGFVNAIGHTSEYLGRIINQYPTLNIDKLNEIKAKSWRVDNSKLVRDFGFSPLYPLDHGLRETIDFYKREGWLK